LKSSADVKKCGKSENVLERQDKNNSYVGNNKVELLEKPLRIPKQRKMLVYFIVFLIFDLAY